MSYELQTIGLIHSPFREKFGIPRQPGLVTEARARLELLPPFDRDETLTGIEGFSHLWLVFVFHANAAQGWQPTVRPPRLGGNQRVGVFASRSSFRPNPLGLSVVELEGFSREKGRLFLHLKGIDLLDGTPVLDIKPYLPYADAIPQARAGYASEPPAGGLAVQFSPAADSACERLEARYPHLRLLITQLLGSDPRPAYRSGSNGDRVFGMRLYDFDLRWNYRNGAIQVLSLEAADAPEPPRL